MILTLVSLGKYLEKLSKRKTTTAIEKLMDLSPKEAVVLKDNIETKVKIEEVKLGEYESIKMLNLLAKVSENIYNMEAIEGYANSEGNLSIEQLMNIIIQEDEIPYYSYQIDSWTMSAEEKYGYRFAKDTGLLDVLKQHGIEGYFDFESYGRDAEMNGF